MTTLLLGGGFSLLLLLIGGLELTASYQSFIKQGFNQARVTNQLLTEWVQGEFREIELIQGALSRQLTAADFDSTADGPERNALETRLVRTMYGMPQTYDMILVDRNCKLILSFKVSPGFDARDRSYCKAMLANNHDDRFVSERFHSSTGDDIVLATQRVRGEDGKVIGLIGSAVRVDHFQTQINRAINSSRFDVMAFADHNLRLLARQPMLPTLPEQPVNDPGAQAMQQQKLPETSYEFASPLDGRLRLHVTRQIERLPIIVTVGIDKNTLLTPWRDKLILFSCSWILTLLLIIYAAHRHIHNITLSKQLAIRSAAIDYATEAIVIANGEGEVQYTNPAFTKMTGLPPESIKRTPLVQLLLGHHPEQKAELEKAIQAGENWREELRSQHQDGHHYHETISVAPVRDQYKQLIYIVAIKYDISAAKKLQSDLERLANTDELTGLNNRRMFLQRAQEEIARSQRHHRPLSLAMLDLDYFKRLNDHYGHGFGDEVLRRFASATQHSVRIEDTCGRLGGEEFAILMPDTDRYNASLIMERVREAIADLSLVNPTGERPVRFTVSIGISELYPAEETATPLIARADAALYLAKQEGRNCVRTS